jgi:hypothetical protein
MAEEEVASFNFESNFEAKDPAEKKRSVLAVQDLATLDAAKLTPLSPQVISRQATINIGCVFFFASPLRVRRPLRGA